MNVSSPGLAKRMSSCNISLYGASAILALFLFFSSFYDAFAQVPEEIAPLPVVAEEVVIVPVEAPTIVGENIVQDPEVIVPETGVPADPVPSEETVAPEARGPLSESLLDSTPTTDPDITLAAVTVEEESGEIGEVAKVDTKRMSALSVDSNTGNLSYTYDFNLPKGRGVTSPSLGLQYSSQGASDKSPFGYGWNIGIPSIERINKKGAESMYGTSTSYFRSSLSGELVQIGTTDLYRAKIETGDFLVYKRIDAGWEVTDKIGTVYFFGTTASARQDDVKDVSRVAKWMLEKVEDTHGNYTSYGYMKDTGMLYPAYIEYTNNASTTGIYRVVFDTTEMDTYTSFDATFEVTRKYLISEITISVLGKPIHSYTLRYAKGLNGVRNLLAGITETGFEGDREQSLPEVVFTYTGATNQPTWLRNDTVDFPEPLSSTDIGVRLADLNGDGLTDIVRYYRNADHDTIPSREYDITIRRVHINKGDGAWDMDVPWNWSDINIPFLYSADGIYGSSRQYRDFGTQLVDVNGDGRDDIVVAYEAPNSFKNYTGLLPATQKGVYINTGTGFERDDTFTGLPPFVAWNQNKKRLNNLARTFLDVNGDGLPDIVTSYFYSESNGSSYANTTSEVLLNTGHGWVGSDLRFPAALAYRPDEQGMKEFNDTGTRFADVNGDGLVDVLRGFKSDFSPNKPSWMDERNVYLNTGNGWATTSAWELPVEFIIPGLKQVSLGYHIVDITGDKLPDIVKSHCSKDCTYQFYLNTGRGWTAATGYRLPFLLNEGSKTQSIGKAFADFDGDTITDALDLQYSQNSATTTQEIGGSVLINETEIPDFLESVTLEGGGKVTATLDGYLDTVQQDYSKIGNPIINPVVVSSITYDSGFGNTWTDTYEYEDAHFYYEEAHLEDRRFAGFGKIIQTGDTAEKTSYYHQGNTHAIVASERNDAPEKIGLLCRVDRSSNSGDLFQSTLNAWDTISLGDNATFVPLKNTLRLDYDGDSDHRDSATAFTYDETNGNLLSRTELGEVVSNPTGSYSDVGIDTRTTSYTYAKNPRRNILGLPATERLSNQTGTRIKETLYMYDSLPLGEVGVGDLTKKLEWVRSSKYVSIGASYDALGLKTEDRDPRGNATKYTYDQHKLYPETTTNALGHKSTYTYDYSSGNIKSVVDPNGFTHERMYDPLDRVVEVKEPRGQGGVLATVETNKYTDTPLSVSVQNTKYLNASTSVDVYAYGDGFGRAIQNRTEAEASGQFVVRDTVYGDDGKVKSTSLPYMSTDLARTDATTEKKFLTTFTKDPLDRTTRVETILGTTKVNHDQWVKTTTDTLNHAKLYGYDAFTRLVYVQEKNGTSTYTTTYAWTPHDALATTTDALRNIRRFTYDGLGRRLTAEDLHTRNDITYGIWKYAYDDAGNRATTTDPKKQVVFVTYDALNRPLTENFLGLSGIEARYTYDTCTNGKGYLCVAKNEGATTTRTYTSSGLIATETKGIDQKSYQQSYVYDLQNNQVRVVYPDSSDVLYTYNTAGQLDKVEQRERNGQYRMIIGDITYGPTGQITEQLHGNGIRTTKTYDDAELYRLRSIVTGSRNAPLQKLTYTYDSVGNIKKVIDASKTASTATTTYGYDDLYRLIAVRARGATSTIYARSYTYNPIGNVTNSDQGVYKYGNTNFANPHAPTTIGNVVYKYDRNGNLASTTIGLQNTFNYRNQLTQSRGGGTATTTYTYDTTGSRAKKVAPSGTTFYVSNLFERGGATSTKHIYIGDTLVADVEGTGVSSSIFHTHLDHLGSTKVVTNALGKVNQVLDYYPFGDSRIHTGVDHTSREYIGQVTDKETDWSYLNARYYDSARGQFITQDPVFWEIGQSEEGNAILFNPQLQNSYAYAGNNPIINKDPSGRCPMCFAIGILALEAYDTYDTVRTIADPNASFGEKAFAGGLFLTPVGEFKALGNLSEQAIKRGAQIPKVFDALRYGREMHSAYRPFGNETIGGSVEVIKEFRISGYGRADGVRIDHKNKVIQINELKPNNPDAIRQGEKQLQRYSQGVSKMPEYKGYTIKTKVDTYDRK